jgi:hypothetical protein
MCAIASRKLATDLKKAGFKPELALSELDKTGDTVHVFVLVNDYIVDVTASQFKKPKLYIVPATNRNMYGPWAGQYRFAGGRNLIAYQRRTQWCPGEVTLSEKCPH